MDIFSHGLWAGVSFGRRNKREFFQSTFFGIMPDLFSFGIFTILSFLGFSNRPDWSSGPPPMEAIPTYVHLLYDITHSLVVFLVVFSIVWFLRKKIFLPMFGWLLHILVDIPTHSAQFFPTPFLWPIFPEAKIDGIPWSDPIIFLPNIILLILAYFFFFVWRRRKNEIGA